MSGFLFWACLPYLYLYCSVKKIIFNVLNQSNMTHQHLLLLASGSSVWMPLGIILIAGLLIRFVFRRILKQRIYLYENSSLTNKWNQYLRLKKMWQRGFCHWVDLDLHCENKQRQCLEITAQYLFNLMNNLAIITDSQITEFKNITNETRVVRHHARIFGLKILQCWSLFAADQTKYSALIVFIDRPRTNTQDDLKELQRANDFLSFILQILDPIKPRELLDSIARIKAVHNKVVYDDYIFDWNSEKSVLKCNIRNIKMLSKQLLAGDPVYDFVYSIITKIEGPEFEGSGGDLLYFFEEPMQVG